ncbi:MAG: YlbF family regulator [Bacilli bacterium]|jgi:cell fate (sporulation/competence/biofilm development) regulator YmcA (YheA/YmcA/DUF963 family)|nr:YlbF family regulator [Bacilli bacterium]
MSKLDDALQNLEQEIMESELVKEYFHLRHLVEENQELKQLKSEVNAAQSALSLSMGNKKLHAIKKDEYEKILAIYDNHPLVANFAIIQLELQDFLKNIADLLE